MIGGEQHVELRADFPGGFEGDTRNAFDSSGRNSIENEMFQFTQQLIRIRKAFLALSSGEMTHYPVDWEQDIYLYFKTLGAEKILVILNGLSKKQDCHFLDIRHQLADFTSFKCCLLYTSPSPRDQRGSRMPSSA